jgi:hypothetical protein
VREGLGVKRNSLLIDESPQHKREEKEVAQAVCKLLEIRRV